MGGGGRITTEQQDNSPRKRAIVLLFSLYLYISGTNTTKRVSIERRVVIHAAGGVAAVEVKIPGI